MIYQKGFIPVAVAIIIAVLVILFVGAGMYCQYQKNNEPHDIIDWDDIVDYNNISNFEECIAAGNPAMESHPRQCIANGKTFVEVLTNINTVLDETDDWLIYTNDEYNYSFQYSSGWTIEITEYDESPFSSDVVVIKNLLDESVLHICPDSRGMSCLTFQDGQWDSEKNDIIVGSTQAEEEVYVFSGPEDCSTCTTRSLISFLNPPDGWKENGQFMLIPASGESFDELKQILSTFKFTN